jgi:four helix bundle protein
VVQNYRDLDVWKMAVDLVEKIYFVTEDYPKKEQYRLVDQLCRAVVSVPSNIAEGSKRHTTREYIRFIGIAQGSLAEVETQIIISERLRYVSHEVLQDILQRTQLLGKKLHALSNALEKKLGYDTN